jgi:cation-transporting ATPase E
VQQVNAIESLSNVDVLCLDKTGTLTANRLVLHAVFPVDSTEPDLRRSLGDFAASMPTANRTIEALRQACEGTAQSICEEVPFSSERKWSALAFAGGRLQGSYVLGAPDILKERVVVPANLDAQAVTWASKGLRVLLLARASHETSLHAADGEPRLPDGLASLGLVSFSDELRPEARETLARFVAAGVAPKIISGDNPQTVAALATQAGLDGGLRVVSGHEWIAMDEAQRAQAAESATIFGRIVPEQKEELVRLLKRGGHYVAMIGDGVNDVLSLKSADLGIAMETGSQAARAVADIILLGDSFAALPVAVQEGQRIRNGIDDILKLFLTRVLAVATLIMAVMILGSFPFDPKQISILTTLTVGIPSIGLAAWSHPGHSARDAAARSIQHFVLPAALTLAVAGIAVYLFIALSDELTVERAQTALTIMTVLCGLVLVPFVEPPTRWWQGGDDLSGDWRPTLLAGALLLAFIALLAISPLRLFFGLVPLSPGTYAVIALIVVIWAIILRLVWRAQLLERFLGTEVMPPGT